MDKDYYDIFYTLNCDYNYYKNDGKITVQKNRYKKTDEEILEDMDLKVVEAFVRRKKMEKINKL